MRWPNTSKDEETYAAMARAFAIVVLPAVLVIFLTLWWLSPPNERPAQSWANGVYENACCPPLMLRDGVISNGHETTHYTVEDSKMGHMIDVERGIGVRDGTVRFGGTFAFVFFNRNSAAMPALKEPYALHLMGVGKDNGAYVFMRRCTSDPNCNVGKPI